MLKTASVTSGRQIRLAPLHAPANKPNLTGRESWRSEECGIYATIKLVRGKKFGSAPKRLGGAPHLGHHRQDSMRGGIVKGEREHGTCFHHGGFMWHHRG